MPRHGPAGAGTAAAATGEAARHILPWPGERCREQQPATVGTDSDRPMDRSPRPQCRPDGRRPGTV